MSTAQNIKTVNQYDLFDLLGINQLEPAKKAEYTLRVARIGLTNAINRILSEERISPNDKAKLQEMLSTEPDSLQIQEFIISIEPNAIQYVTEEITKIKKEALVRQLEDFIHFIRNSDITDHKSEDLQLLGDLIRDLEANHAIESEKINLYNQLKQRYNFI